MKPIKIKKYVHWDEAQKHYSLDRVDVVCDQRIQLVTAVPEGLLGKDFNMLVFKRTFEENWRRKAIQTINNAVFDWSDVDV